jgi:TRAP-type C4-dicarboxylate transport system permease small subunit
MKGLNKIVTAISRLMFVIAGIALASSMVLTVSDVILRSMKRPIVGTYELVGMLGAIVVAFALPQTSRLRGHVVMDFVTDALPVWLQKTLSVITRACAIALFVIVGWNLISMGNDFRRVGEVTATLHLPIYPVTYGAAACCFVECLVLLLALFERKDEGK